MAKCPELSVAHRIEIETLIYNNSPYSKFYLILKMNGLCDYSFAHSNKKMFTKDYWDQFSLNPTRAHGIIIM